MIRALLFGFLLFLLSGCGGGGYQDRINTPIGQCQTGRDKVSSEQRVKTTESLAAAQGSFPQIKLRDLTIDDNFTANAKIAFVYTTKEQYALGFKTQYFKPTLVSYLGFINQKADPNKTLYLDVKLESLWLDTISNSGIYMCSGSGAAFIDVLYTLYDENNNTVWKKKIQSWGVNYIAQPPYMNTWFLTYSYHAFMENPKLFYSTFSTERSEIVTAMSKTKRVKKVALPTKSPQKEQTKKMPTNTDSLMEVGPESLNVHTIRSMINEKIGEAIIISKIKRVKNGYKDFSTEEIHKLKSWGFSENIIATMLDITTALETNQGQVKKQEPQTQKSTVASQQQHYQQQSAGQSVGDKVMEKATEKAVEKVGEMIFKRLF